MLDLLCGDPVLASTREPEPPPSASMRLAVLRCLKPLAHFLLWAEGRYLKSRAMLVIYPLYNVFAPEGCIARTRDAA